MLGPALTELTGLWGEGHINRQSQYCVTSVMVGDIQEAVGIILRVHNYLQGTGTKAAFHAKLQPKR